MGFLLFTFMFFCWLLVLFWGGLLYCSLLCWLFTFGVVWVFCLIVFGFLFGVYASVFSI